MDQTFSFWHKNSTSRHRLNQQNSSFLKFLCQFYHLHQVLIDNQCRKFIQSDIYSLDIYLSLKRPDWFLCLIP